MTNEDALGLLPTAAGLVLFVLGGYLAQQIQSVRERDGVRKQSWVAFQAEKALCRRTSGTKERL